MECLQRHRILLRISLRVNPNSNTFFSMRQRRLSSNQVERGSLSEKPRNLHSGTAEQQVENEKNVALMTEREIEELEKQTQTVEQQVSCITRTAPVIESSADGISDKLCQPSVGRTRSRTTLQPTTEVTCRRCMAETRREEEREK